MPSTSPQAPRLYTIPPSAPFITTLARAVLAGDLPTPGGPKPGPLDLPNTTVYLPTRRAARALREAFLTEAKGDALLLPRIRALGDPDEEALAALPPARLDAVVGGERDAPLGAGVTYRVMLHGVAQHDAYHGGQMSLLRRAYAAVKAGA